jgi:hypothetical protein
MFDRIVKKEDYDYVINKTIGINDTTCKTLFEESMDKNLNSASVYISFHDKISNFFRKIFGKKEKDQTSIDGGELHDVLFKNKE